MPQLITCLPVDELCLKSTILQLCNHAARAHTTSMVLVACHALWVQQTETSDLSSGSEGEVEVWQVGLHILLSRPFLTTLVLLKSLYFQIHAKLVLSLNGFNIHCMHCKSCSCGTGCRALFIGVWLCLKELDLAFKFNEHMQTH